MPGSLCVTRCTPHHRHNGRVREQTLWNAVWPHWGFELSWNLQTPTRDHCGVFFRWAKKRRPRGKPRRVGECTLEVVHRDFFFKKLNIFMWGFLGCNLYVANSGGYFVLFCFAFSVWFNEFWKLYSTSYHQCQFCGFD